jgi:hypothetical protein
MVGTQNHGWGEEMGPCPTNRNCEQGTVTLSVYSERILNIHFDLKMKAACSSETNALTHPTLDTTPPF